MPGWQVARSGLVIAETPSGGGLMGAHAYSCDRGMGIPRHPPCEQNDKLE